MTCTPFQKAGANTIAVTLAAVMAITPYPLRAGDLNAEVNTMFNNLGAIGNYTAPGAFRGQTFNTYTGGSLMMRSPNKVYQVTIPRQSRGLSKCEPLKAA